MKSNLKVLYCFFSFLKVSFKLVYFNWRISTLQYCDGFYHNPSTWIGHRYTCVLLLKLLPSSLPLYLSWLSQSTGFGYPASCIELTLVICFKYGNVHVTVLVSQIIPPSHSPTESKVCPLCLCLLCCPACWIVGAIFLNSIYMC